MNWGTVSQVCVFRFLSHPPSGSPLWGTAGKSLLLAASGVQWWGWEQILTGAMLWQDPDCAPTVQPSLVFMHFQSSVFQSSVQWTSDTVSIYSFFCLELISWCILFESRNPTIYKVRKTARAHSRLLIKADPLYMTHITSLSAPGFILCVNCLSVHDVSYLLRYKLGCFWKNTHEIIVWFFLQRAYIICHHQE